MDDIKSIIREFAIAALSRLAAVNQEVPLKVYQVQRVDFSNNTGLSTFWENVPAGLSFVSDHKDKWESLPETKQAIQALLQEGTIELPRMSDDSGKEITPNAEQLENWVLEKLVFFLGYYIERYLAFDFLPANFEEHYHNYRATWHAPTIDRTVIFPLIGVQISPEVEKIEFAPDLVLTKFDPQLKTRLWKMSPFASPPVDINSFHAARFCIQATYKSPRIQSNPSKAMRDATRLVRAMRLLKAGPVYLGGRFEIPNPMLFAVTTSGGPVHEWRAPVTKLRGVYQLNDNEISSLKDLYHTLTSLDASKKLDDLRVAIHQFERTYARESDEDAIIDLTIGLENTLLFGLRDELKYRLSLRGAALLRKRMPVQDCARLLRVTYDIRSGIVHEGKSLYAFAKNDVIDGVPMTEYVLRLAEVARQVLQEYIHRVKNGETVRQVAEALDKDILTGIEADPALFTPNGVRGR